MGRPKIVCISGSMKFEEQMRAAAVDLSLEGAIVTGPFVNMKKPDPRWATDELADPIKVALDELHFRKIDLADEVIVVAPGGYVGDSTRREMSYASQRGKPVSFYFGHDIAGGSTASRYLVEVILNGPCVCVSLCSGDAGGCGLCSVLDEEWPCPNLDENDYPTTEPSVLPEGASELERLTAERDEWKQAAGAEADLLDEANAEVSRLREQLAAQQPADVVERAALWLFRAKTSRLMPDVLQRASRTWHHVLDQQDRDAWVSYAREMLADLGWGVSSSEVEAPQPQRELDVIKGEQLARIHRFVRDLKDSVPDVTGDPVQDAFNRGYAEADVLTGGALGALLNVRFNEVLDSPEFRAALDGTARDSAPSEASQHKVEVKPQGGGWWKAECAECDLANYTRRRFEAEDWKDQHEADTLRPQLGGVVKRDTLNGKEGGVETFLPQEPGPPGFVLPQKVEGRPSGSERLAPQPVAEYRCGQPAHSVIPCDRCEPIVDGAAKFLGDRWRRRHSQPRCTGISSDALALLGAGALEEVPRDSYPQDYGDLGACERTFDMAPPRIQDRMAEQLIRFREHVRNKWPHYEPEPKDAAQAARSEATPRLRECVERWPDCEEGAYHVQCCRFPKSCSCTVYPDQVKPEDLESPSPSLRKEGEDSDDR